MTRKTVVRLGRYGPLLAIAVMTLAVWRLYRFSYFWLDDFNNIYWVRRETAFSLMRAMVDPTALFFRPLGMWVYWILFQTAHFHPFPYHAVTFLLHGLNAVLLFFLLKEAAGSTYAAGFAVIFFTYRNGFDSIYWNFANIFQLVAFALVVTGLLLYARFGYSIRETLVLTLVLLLAIRAEEQSVILPALWFAYEALVRGRRARPWRSVILRFSVFAAIMAWFGYFKIATMRAPDPSAPYYMNISILTFGRGYGWYFNALAHTNFRWGLWFIISAVLAVLFRIARNRWALFFMILIYGGLLPYVFLVNHRYELYWYLPYAGVMGLLTLAVRRLLRWRLAVFTPRAAPIALTCIFCAVAIAQYLYEEANGRPARAFFRGLSEEYRRFGEDARADPMLAQTPILYFTAVPRFIDSDEQLLTATEFALDRPGVDVRITKDCPPEGVCVAFENGELRRLQ